MSSEEPKGGLKRLQRDAPLRAAEGYAEHYREALAEDDDFLSSLYMDELLTSILLARTGDAKSRALAQDELRSAARHLLGSMSPQQKQVAEQDLDLALFKRYLNEARDDQEPEEA